MKQLYYIVYDKDDNELAMYSDTINEMVVSLGFSFSYISKLIHKKATNKRYEIFKFKEKVKC